MEALSILTYPDARLKQVSEPVEQFDGALSGFVEQLKQTMYAGPGGVGIAAPQVGQFQRIVLVDVSPKLKDKCHGFLTLINPRLLEWSGMVVGREGCMSVPDFTGNVIRAEQILVQAQDIEGREHAYEFEGFEARAVQHEMDHLEGLLFLDRLVSRNTDLFKRKRYK